MNCKETKQLMLQYIDENLSEVQAMGLKEHLLGCSKCQNELATIKPIYGIIDSEKGEFKFNPSLASRVNAIIANKHGQNSILFTPKRYALIASLSVAAVFVGIILGTFFSNVESNTTSINSNDSIELLADEYFPSTDNNPYNFQIEETDNTK